MANFLIGLFMLLVLLFFWSRTFWLIVAWFAGMFLWVSAFGYALSLMFSDSSATPYVWGAILGVPLGTCRQWSMRRLVMTIGNLLLLRIRAVRNG